MKLRAVEKRKSMIFFETYYDVKMNKKKVKSFPYDFFEHVKKRLDKIKFFSCLPCQRLPYDSDKPNRESRNKLCHIEIQRGTIRTNCIDSLDRTNFAQEIIGYKVCLMMLRRMGLSDNEVIRMKSKLFKEITGMYDEMGDQISMQYGGSIAHHA